MGVRSALGAGTSGALGKDPIPLNHYFLKGRREVGRSNSVFRKERRSLALWLSGVPELRRAPWF